MASADETEIEAALLARGVDPAALEAGRKANRRLPAFEYGKVPPGFREVLPPAPLQPGRRYGVTVMGGIGVAVGQLSFTA